MQLEIGRIFVRCGHYFCAYSFDWNLNVNLINSSISFDIHFGLQILYKASMCCLKSFIMHIHSQAMCLHTLFFRGYKISVKETLFFSPNTNWSHKFSNKIQSAYNMLRTHSFCTQKEKKNVNNVFVLE